MSMTKEEALEAVAHVKESLRKLDDVEKLLRQSMPSFSEQIMASCNQIEDLFNNKLYLEAEALLIGTADRLKKYEGDDFDDFMVLAWLQVLNIQLMYAQRNKYQLEQVLDACRSFNAFRELDHAYKIKHLEITVLFVQAECYLELGKYEEALSQYAYILNVGIRAECQEWINAGFGRYIELSIPDIKRKKLTGRSGKKEFKTALQQILNYRKFLKHMDAFNIYFEYVRYLNGSSISGLLVEIRKDVSNVDLIKKLIRDYTVHRDTELEKQLMLL